jgi:hypothetical protein
MSSGVRADEARAVADAAGLALGEVWGRSGSTNGRDAGGSRRPAGTSGATQTLGTGGRTGRPSLPLAGSAPVRGCYLGGRDAMPAPR